MTTYRLHSSPAVYSPGIIAWATNACQFEEDRPEIFQIISKTWPGIPADAIEALLIKRVPFTLEGETLVFIYGGGDDPAV